ncbi:SMP-30/gluconolactonase/LRE family protein [Actinacidiphila sp. ITFR-21]|uniref:SMP-30/gluconolactonase/LRE family protein n=1 Tax=Actinacidiphila sp. ITFR-21 TaxID=3075199 RepID=UPI002889D4F3|nr:hypothetical protein [Streptomyces sp. ITFR-21]WNI19929.1 hypothetical protein RLT57_30770 [Streptomyces sp. ITFR-21]
MSTTRQRRRRSRRLWNLAAAPAVAALAMLTTTAATACTPTTATTTVFATPPAGSPGHLVGIATDRGSVYVGTHQAADGSPNLPSHIYRYNQSGRLLRDYTITGQATTGQGLTNMAVGRTGLLYILDRHPARMITLDPETGVQRTYATFADVPSCGTAGAHPGNCSATQVDLPAYPDDIAAGPDGAIYVTDISQALVWRVPPGGGPAHVWLTDSRLESLFGPCGIRLSGPRTIVLAQCSYGLSDPAQILTASGRIYTLPIEPDGSAGALRQIWQGRAGEASDGIAIGQSGRIYVALAVGNALMTLSADGREITRTPATAADNAKLTVPYDNPASIAILPDGRAVITNQAFLGGPAGDQVVLQARVPDRSERLYHP